MSLTVLQLMELPCLRRAKIIAGHKSADRIVTSISVLEYTTPTNIQQSLYESIGFWGSELVITGFCSIANDVDAQCENIKMMALAGEVGMILYYVGVIMPRVDKRLIELADELGFVLICMPENEPSLRYSEVIREVMIAIDRDELNDTSFAMTLLAQMSKFPKEKQTVRTILRITSDRLRASVAITDADYRVLSGAPWPRNDLTLWDDLVQLTLQNLDRGGFTEIIGEHPFFLYHAEIPSETAGVMHLIVRAEGEKIEQLLWKQVVEGVRLSMGVWGRKHDRTDLSELIRAIILDEPIKMRRLGDLYHIDVGALSDMWILKSPEKEDLSRWTDLVRETMRLHTNVGLCGHYGKDILIFPVGEHTLSEMNEWSNALVDLCAEKNIPATLICCPALSDTADVKYAYEINNTFIKDALHVFPLRRYFVFPEIEFVKECKEITEAGQRGLSRYAVMINSILTRREGVAIVDTLSAFLLDHNSNITETAAAQFVHKNTVKYRLQKAGDLLGFHIGDVPQSKQLYYALALQRMLNPVEHGD